MGHVARLVVGRVEIVDVTFQTCVHDREVLIGESHIDDNVGFVTVEKLNKLLDAVGIDAVSSDAAASDLAGYRLAFAARARGKHYFGKDIGVLGTLVSDDGSHTARSYDKNFSHFMLCFCCIQ